ATTAFLRFAAQSSAPRRCSQCLRTFSSYKAFRQSSKRQLQTASAYHPSTLNLEPPPRTFGVPDTSIAGGLSEVNSTRPPRPTEQRAGGIVSGLQNKSSVSVPEGEAQKTKPTPAARPSAFKPRRYNFKAREATIKLSNTAVLQLRELLNQPEPKLIRIGTKAKGCSGLAYHLEYVDKPGMLDEQVEQDGVKVLIDNKALINIIGSEMDWVEDKLSRRFVFKNPNITEQCGCGESFSVA
ncbi:hypothetical protein K432DRAFT_250898, partial [Lepidopterella palustris CBS 459.81]